MQTNVEFHRNIASCKHHSVTYDHRLKRIGHPVRSAIHKLQIGRLVVGWVTTSEYLLLYVFAFFCTSSCLFFHLHTTEYYTMGRLPCFFTPLNDQPVNWAFCSRLAKISRCSKARVPGDQSDTPWHHHLGVDYRYHPKSVGHPLYQESDIHT